MTATLWLIAMTLTWAVVLVLGFLLLGALRAQGLLEWRLDQLEATMPSHIGRSGLAPGRSAPDFSLVSVQGRQLSLGDLAGRNVLLVFVQSGCGPCQAIVPALNRLAAKERDLQIVAINHGTPGAASAWAAETNSRFPVLVQEDWVVSKKYEALATPFAFLIDRRGIVAAKGIVSRRHHLDYLRAAAAQHAFPSGHSEAAPLVAEALPAVPH